jgi:D-glycero-D-manno-heptose 1,7-bisphosphate phosphatase
MKAAVFLERDGILNVCAVARGQQVAPLRLEQFRVNEAARPLLGAMRAAGLLVIATTNQPAVARGLMSRNEVDLMHRVLRHKLPLDDLLLCASDDPTHPCHKPQPGLFTEAAFKWGLAFDRCFVISDKRADAKAAQRLGCTSVLIRSPWIGDDHHDFVVEDLETAVRKVIALHTQPVARYAQG